MQLPCVLLSMIILALPSAPFLYPQPSTLGSCFTAPVFQQCPKLHSVMIHKSRNQNVFMWGLSASPPFLGVEYDTQMLWVAEQFRNKMAWSQFEILPIFKNILRGGRVGESSEQVFPSCKRYKSNHSFLFHFLLERFPVIPSPPKD